MPDAIITSTASTFGTISGTFAADQSTVTGTVTGIITGTLTGSVGVPGPAGAAGAPGVGVPAGGASGQYLQKTSNADYATDWVTINLSAYAVKANNLSDLTNFGTARTNLGLGTMAVATAADYSTTTVANGLYYPLAGNPSSFLTAAALSPYLTSATAASTYQTLAGMSSYLTTATAASTYAVIAAGQPAAGTTGQVLTKNSGTNYDSSWATLIPGDRYLTTSTTSNTVSNGNKTFTIGTGLSYTPTQNITISYDASNHMHGEVLTYNSGTGVLTVDVNHHTGSGTYTAWVVNVGGVTPATSVAWGAITGTLSAQTDLQSALDAKLAVTTAASTYQTLSGMSSYLTTSTAASTYSPIASPTFTGLATFDNPGNYAISVPASGVGYDIRIEGQLISLRNAGIELIRIGTGGIKYPDGVTQSVAYPGSSTFLLKADNLSGLANTGTARTNLGLGTMAVETASNYLTTATAASTYFTIASAANKADLASPTFTGTPTLPTGTIGVTQSPGNNTTALATTAFVTAAVPAFATTAEIVAATSTTTALAPGNQGFLLTNPRLQPLAFINQSSISGSGAAGNAQNFSRQIYLGSLATGRAAFLFGFVGTANAGFGTSTAKADQVDFSKKVWIAGYAMMGYSGSPSYLGDANTMCRITLGGYSTNTTGDMTLKGIGLKKAGGAASTVSLTVHNGTTRTDVASSVTVADGAGIQWQIYSDGTGNVTLYINGTQAATTTAGPTTATASGQACYREQVEAAVTPGVRQLMSCNGGWFYTE